MEIQILNQFSFPIQIFLDGLQVKIGHECTGGTEEFLGQTASASECAKKCKGKVGCQYFIYGTDNTKCFYEESCSTDKKNADYIIYKMTTGKKVIDCEIYCQRFYITGFAKFMSIYRSNIPKFSYRSMPQ